MIAPDTIITAAHLTHMKSDVNQPNYIEYLLIRAPNIGESFETAQLIAEDPVRDVAILRLKNPRSTNCVILEGNIVPRGTSCGSLGFPLANVRPRGGGVHYSVFERF
ncbi:MAG: hypothetical protein ACFFDT_32185 [Candidatus Hodarchaeota archaeon]